MRTRHDRPHTDSPASRIFSRQLRPRLRPLALGLFAGLSLTSTTFANLTPTTSTVNNTAPVKIIFDTDYSTDCDDPGALAVLHALADYGEAEILATMSSTSMAKSPGAIDVVNTYYNRPDLPIGTTKVGPSHYSFYVDDLYHNFPHDTPLATNVPDAIDMYRQILSQQPDDSVVIVTVGYITNIAGLLQSPPDQHSPLNGHDLVQQKVKEWACMGGNFFTNSSNNVNFTRDAGATYYAIKNFPKKLTFLPREVGSEPSPLRAGEELKDTPLNNPVRVAYQKYANAANRSNIDRHCADLATVLYAVRGARDYWDVESTGSMNIRENATFTWDENGTQDHHYLVMKGGYGVYSNQAEVEAILRSLLKYQPEGRETPPSEEPEPNNGTIGWYDFEMAPGSDTSGAPIVNRGDGGSILDLTQTGGLHGRDGTGNGGYQATGLHGYGFAFDILAAGDGTYHSNMSGSPTGGGLTTSGPILQSLLQGGDGAFTYEAFICINQITSEQTILSHDGISQRGFLFRIIAGALSFYDGNGSVSAIIPTSGPHAFESGKWFHVAVAYNGSAGTSDNLRFYWTALDTPVERANQIGIATLEADLSQNNNLLAVGSTSRSPFRFELAGYIDEVGISGYALDASDFHFLKTPASISDKVVELGPINMGVGVQDDATGTGYILWSAENVHARFTPAPHPDNSAHLIAVRWDGNQWLYNNNNGWFFFEPIASDVLIAEVDFSHDSINSLVGTDDIFHGIARGYASGDLNFMANFWNGSFNEGEFSLSGSTFIKNGDTDGDGLPDAWEIQHRMDPNVSDGHNDWDDDGIPALLEYALGLDPNIRDRTGLPEKTIDDDYLTLTVNRNARASQLHFIPEVTSDLLHWDSGPEFIHVIEDSPTRLYVRDRSKISESGQRFIRLRVEVP